MPTSDPVFTGPTLLERLAPLGGIVFALSLLVLFFTSDDYGDTPQSVIDYADADKVGLWAQAIVALALPLLMGLFVAAVVSRIAAAGTFLRTLAAVGGTLFIALVAVGLTIWSAPLLDDQLNEAVATTYLGIDDFGWVIIGVGGVGMGTFIVAASAAALRLRLVPAWLGWLSLVLGIVSFATAAAVGIFAWCIWLLVAGTLMLLRPAPGSANASV